MNHLTAEMNCSTRPLRRLFDAQALRDNWRAIRRVASAKKLLAVVKSRGYGHGARFVANALADLADGFGVADISDAKIIRAAGIDKPILLMSGVFEAEHMRQAQALNLWTAVTNDRQARWALESSTDAGMTIFVKVNTGMNRLGLSPQRAAQVIAQMQRCAAINKVALMSHFANADNPDGIHQALSRLHPLRQLGVSVSLGNSAALLLHDDMQDDWGRVGIALYGASPAPSWRRRDELGLKAVMTLMTNIIDIRTVAAGDAVGYGSYWRASSQTRIGIAAAGYGDGYPRAFGMMAQVGGRQTPIIGRVSMELITLDLSACGDIDVGAPVILWGQSPTIDEVAAAAGRIAYELLTFIGNGDYSQ